MFFYALGSRFSHGRRHHAVARPSSRWKGALRLPGGFCLGRHRQLWDRWLRSRPRSQAFRSTRRSCDAMALRLGGSGTGLGKTGRGRSFRKEAVLLNRRCTRNTYGTKCEAGCKKARSRSWYWRRREGPAQEAPISRSAGGVFGGHHSHSPFDHRPAGRPLGEDQGDGSREGSFGGRQTISIAPATWLINYDWLRADIQPGQACPADATPKEVSASCAGGGGRSFLQSSHRVPTLWPGWCWSRAKPSMHWWHNLQRTRTIHCGTWAALSVVYRARGLWDAQSFSQTWLPIVERSSRMSCKRWPGGCNLLKAPRWRWPPWGTEAWLPHSTWNVLGALAGPEIWVSSFGRWVWSLAICAADPCAASFLIFFVWNQEPGGWQRCPFTAYRKVAEELVLSGIFGLIAVSDVSVGYDANVYASDASLQKGAFTAANIGAEHGQSLARSCGRVVTVRGPIPCLMEPPANSYVA